ncbi:SPRY-domain-containing protein [Gigaspora margarita]|uniref:SPRY-domain-containing protein n=1 Tax=Gigaspora margarita TaxID=4874 RepID=A0A8H4AWH5_GIGMA|nr:SPRY-domain-containing protein [Gigaspora margarita]
MELLDVVLPTAWDIENKSPLLNIDSNGLRVIYTGLDDNKAAIIRANHPIPSQCGIFYFEVEIINKGKNGMIGVGYCSKQNDKKKDDSIIKTDYINNMLMPGQRSKENELWGCGYHALEDLTRLLKIEPDNVTALKYRGEINYIMKRYDESIADLEKLLTIKPNDTWATEAYELVKEL